MQASNSKGQCTEGSFWIPSLGGPTTVAARQCGSVISWLIPFVVISLLSKLISLTVLFFVFVDHNILEWSSTIGWHTVAYLVLPVLPVVFRFVSMELTKPPRHVACSSLLDYLFTRTSLLLRVGTPKLAVTSFHQVDEALDEAYASSASNRNLGVVDSCAFIASSDMI
ncbi:hypothetical protein Gorai_011521 [Gossypium raimondii]|uniref:Uncharacterized protein n=1 Tax=Gossypium raimondii TaxID=29730 RepID=A0A7J8PZA2_GOSRA|nr:hypothetical protein [Gossypium raimondii]